MESVAAFGHKLEPLKIWIFANNNISLVDIGSDKR